MKTKMLFEEHVIAAMFVIMLIIMGANVITRTIPMGINIAFTEELVVYLFVCTSMVGTSAACARGANMGLSALVDLCPPGFRKVLAVVAMIASILLFAFIFYQGVVNVQTLIKYNQKTPILRIPQWYFTIFYCIGSVLYIFRSIQVTVNIIRNGDGK